MGARGASHDEKLHAAPSGFLKANGGSQKGFFCGQGLAAAQIFILRCMLSQKNFVNMFFLFAWEFCIEKRRGFLVSFFWSPFPTKRSTKSPRKIRGKFGAKFGAKFGTKI